LRDLGYVEGRNVVLEFRDSEGKIERLPALAAELVALPVDVIVVGNTPGATLGFMTFLLLVEIGFIVHRETRELYEFGRSGNEPA